LRVRLKRLHGRIAGHSHFILDQALKLEEVRGHLIPSLSNLEIGRETQTNHPRQSEAKHIQPKFQSSGIIDVLP
jgi:hypothetical protein